MLKKLGFCVGYLGGTGGVENWINNLTILLRFILCIVIIILYQYLAGKSGIIDNLIFPVKSKFNSPSKLDSNHKFC